MLSLLGYSVWIEVDNSALPEFQISVDEPARNATCWIPSEVGKEFAIVFTSQRNECDTLAALLIDGTSVDTAFCKANGQPRVVNKLIGEEDGSSFARLLVAGLKKLAKKEDENYEDRGMCTSQDLGEISVRMNRVHKGDKSSGPKALIVPSLASNVLHEKSKKIVAHCVSFGEVKPTASLNRYKTRYYDPADPRPFAKFIFKYRPAAFLQANEIMPRPLRPPKRKAAECRSEGQDSDAEADPTQQETPNIRLPVAKHSTPKNSPKVKKAKKERVDMDLTDIKSETSGSQSLLRENHSDASADVLALIGDLAATARTAVREAKGNWGLAVDSVTGMEKAIRKKLAAASWGGTFGSLQGKEKISGRDSIDEILTLVGDIAATGRSAVRETKGDWGMSVDSISGLEKEIRGRIANIDFAGEEDIIDLT